MTSDAPRLTCAESVTLVVPLASSVGSIRATLRALVAVVRSVLGGCWVDTIAIEQQLPISAVERLWLLADDVLSGASAGYADRQRLTQSNVAGRAMAHDGQRGRTPVVGE
jgi:hypothetical protein